MKNFYETVRKFLKTRLEFVRKYPQIYSDETLQTLVEMLPPDQQGLFWKDIARMNLFLKDEAVGELARILLDDVFLPAKAFYKTASLARGKVAEHCKSLRPIFQKRIAQDYNIERVRVFEKKVLSQVQQDNLGIAPSVMRNHLETLKRFEAVLQREKERKTVIDSHDEMLNFIDNFERYLQNIAPHLTTLIAKLDLEIENQEQLVPTILKDLDIEAMFRGALRQQMVEAESWPFVPVREMQQALQSVGFRAIRQLKELGASITEDNRDQFYNGIQEKEFQNQFLPAYDALITSLPMLMPIAAHFISNEEQDDDEEHRKDPSVATQLAVDAAVADLMTSWQRETDAFMLSHKVVQKESGAVKEEFEHCISEYVDALRVLDANLRKAKAGYEAGVKLAQDLLTKRLPKMKDLLFQRHAVTLKFRHVSYVASVLRDPEAESSHVDRDLFKRLLATFLHTGRSAYLISQLQRCGAGSKSDETRINAFIQSFSTAGAVANLGELCKILADAEEDTELAGYKFLIGFNPIGRISRPRELIRDLRIELEKIIERENATHAMQRSVESSIQEEEAAVFTPGKQVLNFENAYDDFLNTFKDASPPLPEMLRLRENLTTIFCWPLSEESKFIRMHVALTHMSTTVNALSDQLTAFAAKHYPAGVTKKDKFIFSYSFQMLRSRLDATPTHRKETLLGLYKTINGIALAGHLSETEKLVAMQRVVGSFDYDIRMSAGGSEGWFLGSKGSNLAQSIEAFMRDEWKLNVARFLEQFSDPSAEALGPRV